MSLRFFKVKTLSCFFVMLLSSCTPTAQPATPEPKDTKTDYQWYRDNTHTHTNRCDHADSDPKVVAKWYLDHGYNFLVLSEHNVFIDPKTVKLPKNRRKDFILIPGEEITGKRRIHTTALNVKHIVDWNFDHKDKSKIIQNHVDGTLKAGGQAIVNHPNYRWAVSAKDLLPVKNLHLFELYNSHHYLGNHAKNKTPTTEKIWDELLTKGWVLYGVASDDAHQFATSNKHDSNPGRGWVMVRSPSLDPDSITEALLKGHFYASSGIFLKTYKRTDHSYSVEIDTEKTFKEIKSLPYVKGKRIKTKKNDGKKLGFKIEFIGANGKTLHSQVGNSATYVNDPSEPYVRVKVTYTRKYKKDMLEEFYAWDSLTLMMAG